MFALILSICMAPINAQGQEIDPEVCEESHISVHKTLKQCTMNMDRNIAATKRSVHVTVNEKKAPTDESVKLLMELEKKAQEKIEKSIRLLNTNIDVVIHSYQDFNDQFIHFRIHYMLNGVRRAAVHRLPIHWIDDEVGIAKALLKALSEDIALNLLSESELSLRDLLRS